jgi:S1-C subfamily serine protease
MITMYRLALVLALLSCFPSPAVRAQSKTGLAGETIYEKVLHFSAFILTPDPDRPNRAATGTGSLVGQSPKSGNPVIITNYHVVSLAVGKNGDREVRIMFPIRNAKGDLVQNRERYFENSSDPAYAYRGKVLAYQKAKDLALVELFVDKANGQRLPAGTAIAHLADNSPKPSTAVHTVGNTGAGGMWSYTQGYVRGIIEGRTSMVNLPNEKFEITARVIETSNPTNKGDSGGPLVNDACELVGVTQGGALEANLLSVFIDLQEVKTILREYKIVVPKRTVVPHAATAQTMPPKTDPGNAKSLAAPSLSPRERAALDKLNNAKRAIHRDKDLGLAESFLKDIMSDYDDTKAAVEAKTLLEEIKKKK